MATVDSGLYQEIGRGVKSVNDLQNEAMVQQQNKLAILAAQAQMQDRDVARVDAQRARGADSALARLIAGGGDVAKGLAAQDYGKESVTYSKQQQEQAKAAAETRAKEIDTTKKRIEMVGAAYKYVMDHPTWENADATLTNLLQNGAHTPEQDAQIRKQIMADPSSIGALATQGFQASLASKDLLAKNEFRNRGNRDDAVSTDPVTGKVTLIDSAPIGESANNIANNRRMAAEGAANRRVAENGQKMADNRARDLASATMSKPFEVTGPDGNPVLVQQDKNGNIIPVQGYSAKTVADKPLTEGQAKAIAFGSRMQQANGIFDNLEKAGTITSTPGARSGYGVGAVINALSSSDQQQLNQAKRDFINATLRRESGAVISQSEFENAEQQYFPQIGELADTIAQKRNNREVSMRGVLADVPKAKRDELVRYVTGDDTKPAKPSGNPHSSKTDEQIRKELGL